MARHPVDPSASHRLTATDDGLMHFFGAEPAEPRDDTIISVTDDALALFSALATDDPFHGDPLGWSFFAFG